MPGRSVDGHSRLRKCPCASLMISQKITAVIVFKEAPERLFKKKKKNRNENEMVAA